MSALFKERAAAWTIALLLILNLATLSTIWFKEIRRPDFGPPKPDGRNDNISLFLKSELAWSDSQVQAYEFLRNTHLGKSRAVMTEMRELKRELLDELFEDEPDSLKAGLLIQSINQKQMEMEQLNYSYFVALKKLCGDEQKDRLRGLMNELFFRDQPGGGRPGGPPHGPGGPGDRPPDMSGPPSGPEGPGESPQEIAPAGKPEK
jgi:hypothetical protein